MMPPLRRPDIELFLPDSAVYAAGGSHAGVFALALERLQSEANGRKLVMAGHQVQHEMYGYIVYGWVEK